MRSIHAVGVVYDPIDEDRKAPGFDLIRDCFFHNKRNPALSAAEPQPRHYAKIINPYFKVRSVEICELRERRFYERVYRTMRVIDCAPSEVGEGNIHGKMNYAVFVRGIAETFHPSSCEPDNWQARLNRDNRGFFLRGSGPNFGDGATPDCVRLFGNGFRLGLSRCQLPLGVRGQGFAGHSLTLQQGKLATEFVGLPFRLSGKVGDMLYGPFNVARVAGDPIGRHSDEKHGDTDKIVNAGEIMQRLAGVKVQHGRKPEGPRYRGPSGFSHFIPEVRRPTAGLIGLGVTGAWSERA